MPDLTIIIATLRNAASLAGTLRAIAAQEFSSPLTAELLVVENSDDLGSRSVVEAFRHPSIAARWLSEPQTGQARARNTGLRNSSGRWLLLTDDDVQPDPWWIDNAAVAFARGAKLIQGGIRIPDTVVRPWMSTLHRQYLCSTEFMKRPVPDYFIGANMGFSAEVLTRVSEFDENLDPGRLGKRGDEFFGILAMDAGFEPRFLPDVSVLHAIGPERSRPGAFRREAILNGRSQCYVNYHWHGHCAPNGRTDPARRYARVLRHRISRGPARWWFPDERELVLLQCFGDALQQRQLAGSPRKYAWHPSSEPPP
jgi:glycosyltransferase involved in cell wall biosynthesis